MSANETENLYSDGLAARKEWDDRYLNMSRAIRHWRQACLANLIVIVILSAAVVWLAVTTKVQPFIVETTNGMPYAIKQMNSVSVRDQRIINFAINQFIINARTVLADVAAQKTLLNKVYAFSANSTLSYLENYYRNNNPFGVAEQYTVAVKIVNALPISRDTWQVVWEEEKQSLTVGNVTSVSRWMANLSYQYGEINPQFIVENPFGIYVTQLSWSQSLN